MIALDLFAGTGWGVACQALGIEEYGVEIMPEAVATRELNGMTTIYNDVWEGLEERPVEAVKNYSRDPKRLDKGVLPWVSMAEALGWGRTARPSVTVTGGGTETGGAEPLAKLAREVAAADWVVRLDPSLPATTVAGDPRLSSRDHHEHGAQNGRATRITVAEAAALQSYPPGFTFAGTKTKQFLQVGNAVPPLLAEAILRAVIS